MQRMLAILLLITLAASAAAADWVYTFRPGDTVWALAEKYCGSNRFAQRIVEHNQLANARAVRPGTRIKIPIAWLVRQPVQAEVLSVRGVVWLHAATRRAAQAGDRISIGDRLETGEGNALVALADGSRITINAQSDIRFQLMSAFGDTGMVDTHLNIRRGRSVTRAATQQPGSQLRISSPAGTAAVRGTEFRVAVTEEDEALTETLEGEVAFQQTTEVSVPAGFGVRASTRGIVKEPLLEAPQWQTSPGKHTDGSRFRWQPLAGAKRYRVAIYSAGNAATALLQQSVTQPEFTAPPLSAGRYQLRVRGVSPLSLEGFDAALDVEIAPPAPQILSRTDTPSEQPTLKWRDAEQAGPQSGRYEVQVADDGTFSKLRLSEEITGDTVQPKLPPGRYKWRVRGRDSAFSEAQDLVVAPAPPAGLVRQAAAGQSTRLTWQADGRERVPRANQPQQGVLTTARGCDHEGQRVHGFTPRRQAVLCPRDDSQQRR